MRQGNRISHCEKASEESVGTVGFFQFAADGQFGGLGVELVDRHVFENGEVLWTVVTAVAGAVLVHVYVEHPVEAVSTPQWSRAYWFRRSGVMGSDSR